MENQSIYFYSVDFGRHGTVEGTILTTANQLKKLFGKSIYFGDVLGKHSDVSIIFEDEDDFELLTSDQEFIKKAVEYKVVPKGYDPFDYIDLEEEEDSSSE